MSSVKGVIFFYFPVYLIGKNKFVLREKKKRTWKLLEERPCEVAA